MRNWPGGLLSRACIVSACVALPALSGCEQPQLYPSKGARGAADAKELVARYQQAHRTKDIESLRAIYQPLRFSNPGPWGDRMIGQAEQYMPALFELELVDIELIEFPGEPGAVQFDCVRERVPGPENDFSAVRFCSSIHDKPYKLMLVGRRPNDAGGPAMEIDIGLGVEEFAGRLYLTADSENLSSVTEWIRTGRLPDVYRPKGHRQDAEFLKSLPKQVPADWVRIVRPRP